MEKIRSFHVFILVVFLLVLVKCRGTTPTPTGGTDHNQEQVLREQYVRKHCGFTRYPTVCMGALQGSSHGFGGDLVAALVEKLGHEIEMHVASLSKASNVQNVHNSAIPDESFAIDYCVQLMGMSQKRLNQSLSALQKSPRKSKPDLQAWLSAVLTFQEACKDTVHGRPGQLPATISTKMDDLSKHASNALALANRIGSPSTGHRRRLMTTSGDGRNDDLFPNWVLDKDQRLLQSAGGIDADAVVAQDGTGNYKTIAEAINAASGGRFVIHVKAGVYKEKIHTNKDGITLIGDGKYVSVITGHDSTNGGDSMPNSATFAVSGDGFIARDIGFQNTAGPGGGQALALRVSSDHSVFYRCSIRGYQDTLYALALRQFYRECDIQGSVDFIFGNAAAVFQSCNILLRESKNYDVILANGRSDPGQSTGFSLQRCKIADGAGVGRSYLGRPWKQYSRAVVMQSSIDSSIAARGWIEWDGEWGLKTLYFAEYLNSGPGAGTGGRVKWGGYHVIGEDEAVKFTVGNFISGSSWLPSTGVAFESGL